jgi:predicted metal-binding membrane protein
MSPAPSERIFLLVALLLFLATAAVTIMWSISMSDMSMPGMGAMPTPGGMSMQGMPMCGRGSARTWFDAAVSFLGMWVVMTIAMMTPSLVPMLSRYRRTLIGASNTRSNILTALVAAAYIFAWILPGIVVLLIGNAATGVESELPAVARIAPSAGGIVVLIAGAIQVTRWKANRLACCNTHPECMGLAGTAAAWQHGLRLGLRCMMCCANLMAVLLVIGIMDLPAMAFVTIAIALERLSPARFHLAQTIGIFVAGTGAIMISQAAGV